VIRVCLKCFVNIRDVGSSNYRLLTPEELAEYNATGAVPPFNSAVAAAVQAVLDDELLIDEIDPETAEVTTVKVRRPKKGSGQGRRQGKPDWREVLAAAECEAEELEVKEGVR